LEPSDSAPGLQYDSGPSSGFLARILGVDTPLFLCNTQLYFPLCSLFLRKSRKRRTHTYIHTYIHTYTHTHTHTLSVIVQLVVYVGGGRGSIPRQKRYQLNYCEEQKTAYFYDTYEPTAKKVQNKILYYKETVECRHLIFWPGSQRRVHCHTANPEPNRRVAVDGVTLPVC
jgi:hypothetical protein